MTQREKIREILFNWHKWRDYYYSDLKEQVITDDEWKVTRDNIDDKAITQIETLITEGRLIELDLLEQAINQDLDMYKFKMMRLEALQASLKGTSNAGKA